MDRFSGVQIGAFVDLLQQDFNPNSFDQFLLARLNRVRFNITLADNFVTRLYDVAMLANQELWHLDLLNAAVAARPKDKQLGQFAEPFIDTSAKRQNLEGLLDQAPFWDPADLRARMVDIENHVCRVEVNAPAPKIKGSGFLVGADRVLTNYHVVERLITGKCTAKDVLCRFDYKKLGDKINSGTLVGLDPGKPVLSYSKYSPQDSHQTAMDQDWGKNEFDYAVLKLDKSVGDEPPGPLSGQPTDPDDKPRDWEHWVDVAMAESEPLFLWQHPSGDTIKLTTGKSMKPWFNAGSTRVRYTNNSLPGSSGSPCFDARLRWVALHHAGDPDWEDGVSWATYNQGIPAARVVEACKVDGVALA